MNFIANETPQKLRGGYYTDPDIAAFLTKWVLEIKPRKILEPSCGDGNFFEALSKFPCRSLKSVVGCELNPEEATKAQGRAKGLNGSLSLVIGDFLQWSLEEMPGDFDAVLGNPPFIRYQYLDPHVQPRAAQIFQKFDLPFTKHTNAWVPFIIASLALLRPGGRLAMVVPSELLHVIHARSLRHFLLQECSRILVIDPEDIWFGDTLQGVVLLLAEKRAEGDTATTQVSITAVHGRDALHRSAQEYFKAAEFFPGSILNGKWMLGLLNRSERALLERMENETTVRTFSDIASVDVGIVTGANNFFLVTDEVVQSNGLEQWSHPMFGRSEHVCGAIYDHADHDQNKAKGMPTNFLWFKPDSELTASAKKYIKFGESQNLHVRYKCRMREPWYSVPSVYSSPVGMLKRAHHLPRMVLNKLQAFTTDTAYRIKPAPSVRAADLVFSFINSLTALSAELEGRHYGGGVLELVPSEIERLLVPLQPHGDRLEDLDKYLRKEVFPDELLERQDALLLQPLGVSRADRSDLLSAWHRLRIRRQRGGVNEAASS